MTNPTPDWMLWVLAIAFAATIFGSDPLREVPQVPEMCAQEEINGSVE